MLCVNSYQQDYIDACRARMETQIAAYRALAKAARAKTAAPALRTAADRFEPLFFNNLVVVLDALFMHRSHTLELKDGNPLNEVRMLCASILEHGAVLTADKAIKFKPERSVLKLTIGDAINLSEADFGRLCEAFFAEIGAKFTASPARRAAAE